MEEKKNNAVEKAENVKVLRYTDENAKVYYANEWHYDSNGKPVLNETETEII